MTDLVREATLARENALALFSKYKVGAALRTSDGKVYRGCNVENSTYGLTVCAERVALLSALAAGERKFTAIAVVTQSDEPGTPCGPCRQLMWEYCGDIPVVLADLRRITARHALAALARLDSPYSITFPNIYPDESLYGAGLVVDGQVQFGFPYPPLSLLMALARHLPAQPVSGEPERLRPRS